MKRKLLNGVGAIVDRLGQVRADMADLSEREEQLKAELIRRKVKAAEGRLFRATVSTTDEERLDITAIKEDMPLAWLRKHTMAVRKTVVRVTARKPA